MMKTVEIVAVGLGLVMGFVYTAFGLYAFGAFFFAMAAFLLIFENRCSVKIRLRPWLRHCVEKCEGSRNNTAADNILIQDEIVFRVLESGNAAVHLYEGASDKLIIPEIVQGHTVTAIDSEAFGKQCKFSRIHIPGTVCFIDKDAFKNCDMVESIDEDLARAYTANSRRDLLDMFGWGYEAVESRIISGESFVKTGYGFTALVEAETYAEQYCRENSINYVLK